MDCLNVLLGRVQVKRSSRFIQLHQQIEQGRVGVSEMPVVGILIKIYMKTRDDEYAFCGNGSS